MSFLNTLQQNIQSVFQKPKSLVESVLDKVKPTAESLFLSGEKWIQQNTDQSRGIINLPGKLGVIQKKVVDFTSPESVDLRVQKLVAKGISPIKAKQQAQQDYMKESAQNMVFGSVGGMENIEKTLARGASKIIKESVAKYVKQGATNVQEKILPIVGQAILGGEKQIKTGGGWSTLWNKGLVELYDRLSPINKFVSQVVKTTGNKVTTEEDPYVAARLYSGVGGKIEYNLNNFGKILKANADIVKSGDLSKYLFLERSIERGNRGFSNPGGITSDMAKQGIEELKTKLGVGFNKVQKASALIYKYGDDLLNYITDSGIISKETRDTIKKSNQMYVPFDVIEHMANNENLIPNGTKAFSVGSQNLIKGIVGTEKVIDDPINAMIRKVIQATDLVERNGVAQKLISLGDKFVKDSPIRKLDTSGIITNTEEKINVFKNGVKESYAVPKDIGEAMKRMTSKQADMLTHVASIGTRALRSGATSMNIAFIVPNALRDFETATLVSKYGFNVADWTKGFWQAIKGQAGEIGFKVNDSIYQNYLKDAGRIGGYFSTYLNDVPKTKESLMSPLWKELLKRLNPIKLIEDIGTIIERTPRLGVYMKALSKGESGAGAGFLSREATVDFAKMGDAMKVFNMLVPFINARLQGEVNIAKSLASSIGKPKRMAELALKIGGLAIVPFVGTYYWNTSKFPQVWDDLADYEKANYVLFIYGNHQDNTGHYDQVLKFPKGDWNYFIDPVQDFLEWTRGKQPNLFKAIAYDSLFNILPLSTTPQESFSKTVEQAMGGTLPPPIKAGVEDLTNMNMYTMRPIVPQSLIQASPEQQYKNNTPLIAQKIGQYLNISPLKIENTMGTIFGGFGRQVVGLGGTVEKPGITPPFGSVASRFKGAVGGQVENTESQNLGPYQAQMYDRKIIAKRSAENVWNALQNSKSVEEADNILKDISTNKDVVDALKTLIENQATKTTYLTTELQVLSPPERAKYIVDKMKTFKTDQEYVDFLSKLKTQGLLTDDTKKEMGKLMGK